MPPEDSKATDKQLKRVGQRKRSTQIKLDSASNGSKIPEVRRAQLLEPGRYLARNLPPMHKLKDIFNDLAENAIRQGFSAVLNHLAGRPLRVATMCSGTESPLLALEMIQNGRLRIEHLFSCEIVPFKQAYIERNFHPPILFRDIRELGNDEAQTAYGSLEKIPRNPDLLVAGTACVDFSNLNSQQKTLRDDGESGRTFKGMLNYAQKYRPALVIQENVRSAPWAEIARKWESIDYFATWAAVDTKAYYIPQTRERGYMVCIDKVRLRNIEVQNDTTDDAVRYLHLGARWKELLSKFTRPASSPAGMFLLDEDDRRLERIEKDMSTRLNATAARAEVAWERYKRHRNDYDVGNQRPITRSQPGSFVCHPPDFYWYTYINSQAERVWDTLDINFLRKIVTGDYDMNFKERWIELSQGVDRGGESKSFGIIGCITPCGMPFLTTRGAPLTGLEALALQGLPLDRISLTRESQRELQDLAGNAMSSTCVGVAILAALLVGYNVLERGNGSMDYSDQDVVKTSIIPQEGYDSTQTSVEDAQVHIVDHVDLQARAASSASYCTCEKQSAVRTSIFRCGLCKHTACSSCSGNPSHSYEPLPIPRSEPSGFTTYLKDLLPIRLKLTGISIMDFEQFVNYKRECVEGFEWQNFTEIIKSALCEELRFFDITRGRVWKAVYKGRHSNSSLSLIISSTGLQWIYYANPPASAPSQSLIREILAQPIARMTPRQESLIDGDWEVCSPFSTKLALTFAGSGSQVKTFQAECGLQTNKYLNSRTWSRLTVGGEAEDARRLDVNVRGEYEYLPDCGTALGSLYKKAATGDCPTIYLFLDPTKHSDPDGDCCVFSLEHDRIPGYSSRITIAELEPSWRAWDMTSTMANANAFSRCWAKISDARLERFVSGPIICKRLKPGVHLSIGNKDCHESYITLLSLSVPATTSKQGEQDTTWRALDTVDPAVTLKNFAWLVQKVSGWRDFQDWHQLNGWDNLPYTEETACESCHPPKPSILWGRDQKNAIVPYENPKEAGAYERAAKSKPPAFLVFRQGGCGSESGLRFTLNVQTLAHQAYGKLVGTGPNDGISLHWRLIPDAYDLAKLKSAEFALKSNQDDTPRSQPPHFKEKLRKEQLRSLAWAISQEAEDVAPFLEEETEEAVLPLMPWRAEVKAAIPKIVRGGVLADEVGYGKTAVILGLIDAQIQKDRSLSWEVSGLIPTHATLIVVPDNVFEQWQSEINKFLDSQHTVLAIQGVGKLRKLSIRDIQGADIIVVAWKVFSSNVYYETLQQFTGTPEPPVKAGRNFDNWFQEARQALKDLCDILTSDGPEEYLRKVQARRAQVKERQAGYTYMPSRRVRGKGFALAQQEKQASVGDETSKSDFLFIKDGDQTPDDKPVESANCLEKACTDEVTERISEESQKKVTKRKRDQEPDNNPTPRARDDRELFNIPATQKDHDWRDMRYPFLHLFSFNRIVIDEYTYTGEERLISILSLHARSKWILSGTPAMSEFADIKSIARYLDLYLGVDDDGDVPTQNSRLKSIRRRYTAAESFQMYQPRRSDAWYSNRREIAQRFLDKFARQNIAEIDHIATEIHLVVINQSPMEQQTYQALFHALVEQNGRHRKIRNPNNDLVISRLNDILGSSKAPLEALVKYCASTKLQNNPWDVEAYKSRLKTHRQTRTEHCSKLEGLVKQAAMIIRRWKMQSSLINRCLASYDIWVGSDDGNDVTAEMEERFAKASKKVKKPLAKSHTKEKAGSPKDNRGLPGGRPSKRAKLSCSGLAENSKAELQYQEVEAVMKALAVDVNSILKLIVQSERDIRLSEAILNLQTAATAITCSKCNAQQVSITKVGLLASCGHLLCEVCIDKIPEKECQCLVPGCDGSAKPSKIVHGSSIEGGKSTDEKDSKIEKLVEILQQVPADELVLVFVQFEDLMPIVSRALKANGIEHRMARAGYMGPINEYIKMNDRKSTGKQKTRPKVLILQLGSSMAAGLYVFRSFLLTKLEWLVLTLPRNLQCANHVIFLSPLLVPTQQDWNAGMTQAIGRARRYGQTRTVHVYHLLMRMTVDVNVMQEREGKILVERAGALEWVSKAEGDAEGVIRCEGEPFDVGV
ncbi:hypothetical protein N7474_007461 [Penicillium riverlandense]|uniref:uncharacterized protein n=1 Tax=Penicillium riverlandense TaxID=1903569 RepID=UPI002546E292|nr:uncharacterized protein N7474_007461 [Penicillium riverlandense]KAJ5815684.1 hypothetical protein N7474_007461 [Penicillium riverlandense]